MKHIVLIIGNGFDLDLGLKTSYSDFINTGVLNNYCNNPLIDELLRCHRLQSWIDIEEFLRNQAIATQLHPCTIEDIINGYGIIRAKLLEYIKALPYNTINNDCMAIRVLSAIVKEDANAQIFNFNYTNLREICNSCFIGRHANIFPIHGEGHNDSIILGFDDDAEIRHEEYGCMIKSHSPYYRSANINKALVNADEIVFFGHSLGSTDYHYFRNFFRSRVNENCINESTPKRIRIFTYDEPARQKILLQIRNMNDRKTNMLYDLNDFRIYRTVEDRHKIEQYCNEGFGTPIKGRANYDIRFK